MERVYRIIGMLLENEDYLSIETLGKQLGVTTRTIRSDLDKVEDYLAEHQIRLIRDKHLGVCIRQEVSDELYYALLQKGKESDYYTAEEREEMILEFLLLEKEDVTVHFLTSAAKSSRTTILKDLMKCEERLFEKRIRIVRQPYHGMYLKYEERDYRDLVYELLIGQVSKVGYYAFLKNLENQYGIFPELASGELMAFYTRGMDFEKTKRFLECYEQREEVKFSDEAYVNSYIYLCIAQKRIEQGHAICTSWMDTVRFVDNGDIAQNLEHYRELLAGSLGLFLEEEEMSRIFCFLLAENKTYYKLGEKYGNEQEVVLGFLSEIERLLRINLISDHELFEGLLLHIIPTIHRLSYGIKIVNPLKEEVKEKFPEIFRACRESSRILEQLAERAVNEDEISFLTLHVAASIERQQQNARASNMKKVLLICFGGVGTSNILSARLNTEFPGMLLTKIHSLDELQRADADGYDFIISTVPISFNLNKKVLRVNALLNERDIEMIRQQIYLARVKNQRVEKRRLTDDIIDIIAQECNLEDYETLRMKLDDYFREKSGGQEKGGLRRYLTADAVTVGQETKDWKEAVRISGELLHKGGYIRKCYIAAMIEAVEEMGDYSVLTDGVALAHARPRDGVIKTGFSFVTLSEAVPFGPAGTKRVKLIIGLAADGSAAHIEAVNELFDLLRKEQTVDLWCAQRTKEDFIRFAADREAAADKRKETL